MRTGTFALVVICSAAIAGCIEPGDPDDDEQLGETSAEIIFKTRRVGLNVAVICVNGAAFTGTMSTGLNMALANYNALALTFRMTRTTGSTTGCNAVINASVVANSFGLTAAYPSGNLPGRTIAIGGGSSVLGVEFVEGVITHALGHTVGAIHSDTLNPQISCSDPDAIRHNESPDGGIGTPIPPGMPPPTAGGSIMNTCIPTATNGELTANDAAGLRSVY